jgi:hypothetical protein
MTFSKINLREIETPQPLIRELVFRTTVLGKAPMLERTGLQPFSHYLERFLTW